MPTNRKSEQPDAVGATAILDAGIAHVVAEGFNTLTLRPLAERAGVSVGTISHYMGAKDQLLSRIVVHARTLDAAFFAPWMERARLLGEASHAFRLALVEETFNAWIERGFDRVVLYCELVGARGLTGEVQTALAEWAQLHNDAWAALMASAQDGRVLSAYLTDEAAFTISLGANPAYRCLRRLCLERLLGGPEAMAPARDTTLSLFRRFQAELAPPRSVVGAANDDQPAKKQAIAKAAGQVIVRGGVEAVTHRAVAQAAGAPASTVVYHFGAREALVEAGLEAVIRHFHSWRARRVEQMTGNPEHDFYRPTEDLVRATHAVAVGAMRYPALVSHAADMRRRRGENVQPDNFVETSGLPAAAFDPVSAQVLSVITFGARMLAMSLGRDQHEAVLAACADLRHRWARRGAC